MLPHWTEHDVDANGVAIHYVRTGSGEKPPLMLLHGFSDNGLCWLRMARELEREWDIFLPDAHAHGRSQRVQPGEVYDMPADTHALIHALGLQKPVVGGHSMGAATAAALEARFPGTARALLLEDPPWRNPEPPKQEPEKPGPNRFRSWILDLQGKSKQEIIAGGKKQDPNWPEIEWDAWADSKMQLDPNILEAEGTHMDWQDAVAGIHCPTLLITADVAKGAIVPPEIARTVQQTWSNIGVVQIANAGHNIRRDNFDAYMQAVRSFLSSLS